MARSETGMGHVFDDPGHYERFSGLFGRRLWARVVEDVAGLELPAGALVIDVGTGPGRLPVAIARRCPELRVAAVDVSARMVERARAAAAEAGVAVDARVADVAALPHEPGRVDLVVSTISLHHWSDVAAGVRDLARVLAPGGRLWIYDVRRVLRPVELAARVAFPGGEVRLDRVEAGLIGHLLARLTVEPARVPAAG